MEEIRLGTAYYTIKIDMDASYFRNKVQVFTVCDFARNLRVVS